MVVCESGKREERSDELMERCEEKKNINRRTGDEESGRREESRAEGKEREGVWPPALVHNISRTRTHNLQISIFIFLPPPRVRGHWSLVV